MEMRYRGSAATLNLNDVNSSRWQRQNPKYFGFTLVQQKEVATCRPSILHSVVQSQ